MALRSTSFSERLLDYTVFDGHQHVEGWLDVGAIAALLLISETQRAAGLHGSLAEIGVHHGRLFIVLCLLRASGEKALAIDVFEDQHLNVDGSGEGNRELLERNLSNFVGDAKDIVVWKSDSLKVRPEDLLRQTDGQRVRIFSIDGCHTAEHTFSDLLLARDSLADAGVIVVDDFTNPSWPGVAEGVDRFFASDQRGDIVPVAFGDNKLHLARESAASLYLASFESAIADGSATGKQVLLFGFPCWDLSFGRAEDLFEESDRSDLFGSTRSRVVSFRSAGRGGYRLVSGWSSPEPWGVWSDGPHARLELPGAIDFGANAELLFELHAFVTSEHPERAVNVSAFGRQLARWVFRDSSATTRSIVLPMESVRSCKSVDISFEFENPLSPSSLGISADPRKLAVGLHSLSIRPASS